MAIYPKKTASRWCGKSEGGVMNAQQQLEELTRMETEAGEQQIAAAKAAKEMLELAFKIYYRKPLPLGAEFQFNPGDNKPWALRWEHDTVDGRRGVSLFYLTVFMINDLPSFAQLVDEGFFMEAVAELNRRKETAQKVTS